MLRRILSYAFVLFAVAASNLAAQRVDSILPDKVCTHPAWFVGPCATVRGRLSYNNGGIPVQMWKVGTNRILGVQEESYSSQFCVLPPAIRALLDKDNFVFADFVVRPLTPEEPEVMRLQRISAPNLRISFIHVLRRARLTSGWS